MADSLAAWLGVLTILLASGLWVYRRRSSSGQPKWSKDVLSLKSELEAAKPSLADSEFLYARSNSEHGVYLSLSRSGGRASAACSHFRRTADGWRKMPSGYSVGLKSEVGTSEFHDEAQRVAWDELTAPIPPHSEDYVHPRDREPVIVADQAHLPVVEIVALGEGTARSELGDCLPAGHGEFIIRFGSAMICEWVRVYDWERIRSEVARFQDNYARHYFWLPTKDVIDQRTLIECLPIADTLDGDMLAVHPDCPERVFLLPRHDNRAAEYHGFWSAVAGGLDLLGNPPGEVLWVQAMSSMRSGRAVATAAAPASPPALVDRVRSLGLHERELQFHEDLFDNRRFLMPGAMGTMLISWLADDLDADATVLLTFDKGAPKASIQSLSQCLADAGYTIEWT